tara:strand:+ start:3507 stop:4034 length:528 start_codon:yes stop_codon:yes gene_type:complete
MAKKKTISEIREKPGMSNAGKYKNVKSSDFAGPNGTYPINTLKRAKSALRLAHFASNPGNIVSKVYKKYPELKEQDKDNEKKKAPTAYGSGPLFSKPPKYKKGDLMSEDDIMENKQARKYGPQGLSEIKEDDKGQFMVELKENEYPGGVGPKKLYPGPKPNIARDTIRPKKGKYF